MSMHKNVTTLKAVISSCAMPSFEKSHSLPPAECLSNAKLLFLSLVPWDTRCVLKPWQFSAQKSNVTVRSWIPCGDMGRDAILRQFIHGRGNISIRMCPKHVSGSELLSGNWRTGTKVLSCSGRQLLAVRWERPHFFFLLAWICRMIHSTGWVAGSSVSPLQSRSISFRQLCISFPMLSRREMERSVWGFHLSSPQGQTSR